MTDELDALVIIGIASGLFQTAGYAYYFYGVARRKIHAQPISWLMWGYGTALMFALEWAAMNFEISVATGSILFLPGVCAACSVVLAGICWWRGTLKLEMPDDRVERFSLKTDLTLTAFFMIVWLLKEYAGMPEGVAHLLYVLTLIVGAASTFVTFVPMWVATWKNPADEHPIPWSLWLVAYGLTIVATGMSPAGEWYLYLYPLACFITSMVVGLISLGQFRKPRRTKLRLATT